MPHSSSSARPRVIAVLVLAATLVFPATALADGSINYGGTVRGVIDNTNWNDYWSFNGSAGDSITVSMEAPAAAGNLDPWLTLWIVGSDGKWSYLATDDNSGGGMDAWLSYTLPKNATYVIEATRLSDKNGRTSGSYFVTLTLVRSSAGGVSGGSESTGGVSGGSGSSGGPSGVAGSQGGVSGASGSQGAVSGRAPSVPAAKDSDMDGLSDELEQWIAWAFKPLLVFDENEQTKAIETLSLYQVSPMRHHSGVDGAMLTFVFLYPTDDGADFDRSWKDWFSDTSNAACGTLGDPFDQLFGKHCGDDEVIYIAIGQEKNWQQNVRILSIYWKRHFDPIYETAASVVEMSDYGTGGARTHPVIYVSEDKHGMYPSVNECESYRTSELAKRTGIACYPKMEDCGGGTPVHVEFTFQQNVGEYSPKEAQNHRALDNTTFAGYTARGTWNDPWADQRFWGNGGGGKGAPLCGLDNSAGAIARKWCGVPAEWASRDHPCAGPNW